MTPVVAVINMKGGVGKTTLAANVFRQMFRKYKLNTLLVDFDPQFNLTQLLVDREQYQKLKDEGRTLWSVMNPGEPKSVFEVSEGDLEDPGDVSEYIFRLRRTTRFTHENTYETVRLSLIAGDVRFAMINLAQTSNGLRLASARLESFIRKARELYDIIVVDCNPASTFMTLKALEHATHLLIPVRPDKYSILGLETLAGYVANLPVLNPVPEFFILINGVPWAGDTSGIEAELRGHDLFGKQTLVKVVAQSSLLSADPAYTGFADDRPLPNKYRVGRMLTDVADELASKLGL